jgi:hypothetical protein
MTTPCQFEILDWTMQCCHTVFPETQLGEWSVKLVDAPGTGSHYFIDLVRNSAILDFSGVAAD